MGLEIILRGDSRVAPVIYINNRPAELLGGFIDDLARVEHYSWRSFVKEIHLVYEDVATGIFYLRKTDSIASLSSEVNFAELLEGISYVEDKRYLIFGSKELYREFFLLLNERAAKGQVTEDDYIDILNTISWLHDKIVLRTSEPNKIIYGVVKRFFPNAIRKLESTILSINVLSRHLEKKQVSGKIAPYETLIRDLIETANKRLMEAKTEFKGPRIYDGTSEYQPF